MSWVAGALVQTYRALATLLRGEHRAGGAARVAGAPLLGEVGRELVGHTRVREAVVTPVPKEPPTPKA